MTDQRWTIKPGRVPALLWPDDENPDMPFSLTEADLAEMLPDALDRQVASAFAALRDALARDAQVREILERQDKLVLDQAIGFIQIRSLHHAGDGWGVWAEDDIPATMLRDGKG